MVVGDSPLAPSPGLPQDSLALEPVGSPEPLALAALVPPAHLGQLLASCKLEQVLERSRHLRTSPASLSQHHRSPKPPGKPGCEMLLFGAGEQQATEAEAGLGAGLEEAEVVSSRSQAGEEGDGGGSFPQGWGAPHLFSLELSLGGAFLVPN